VIPDDTQRKTLEPSQIEELERRIRDAREKSSEYEEKLSERERIKELEKRAQFEENKARDLPYIQAVEDEYGEIRVHNTPLGAVVVRKPHHLVFQKFSRNAASSKGMKDQDIWALVRSCVVYPDITKVEDIVEEYPGVTAILATKIIELGNGEAENFEGK